MVDIGTIPSSIETIISLLISIATFMISYNIVKLIFTLFQSSDSRIKTDIKKVAKKEVEEHGEEAVEEQIDEQEERDLVVLSNDLKKLRVQIGSNKMVLSDVINELNEIKSTLNQYNQLESQEVSRPVMVRLLKEDPQLKLQLTKETNLLNVLNRAVERVVETLNNTGVTFDIRKKQATQAIDVALNVVAQLIKVNDLERAELKKDRKTR